MECFEAKIDHVTLNGELKVPISIFRYLEPEYTGLPEGYSIHQYIPGIENVMRGEGVLSNYLPTKWDTGDRYISRIEEFRRFLNELKEEEADRQKNMQSVKFERLPYDQKRSEKYPPIQDLVVALWEMIVEKRSEGCDKIQKIREEIKSIYPKEGC